MTTIDETFENGLTTPAPFSSVFSTDPDGSTPDESVAPLFVSSLLNADKLRVELEAGAAFLGYAPLRPAQYTIADAINAADDTGKPLHRTVGIGAGRRSGKTVAVWCVALGRMLTRPGYRVCFTAQNGIAAYTRFIDDVYSALAGRFDMEDKRSLPFTADRSRGSAKLTLSNGSVLQVKPPIENAMRGNAYDLILVDEGQKFDADQSKALLRGLTPTTFGRRGAQTVILGSAGEYRAGLMWDTLERGRDGEAGIVEFAAPDTTPVAVDGESVEGTTSDPTLWPLFHPGADTAEGVEDLEAQLQDLGAEAFAREFAGVWPHSAGSRFIDLTRWSQLVEDDLPATPPERFALAFSVHPDRLHASITASWRTSEGRACVALLDHRRGIGWLPHRLLELSRRLRVPITYDSASSGASTVVEELNRAEPRPRLDPRVWADVSNAAQLFMKEIDTSNLRHFDQPDMTLAATVVQKRGTPKSNRWAFGRPTTGEPITPIESGSLALWAYDQMKAPSTFLFAA